MEGSERYPVRDGKPAKPVNELRTDEFEGISEEILFDASRLEDPATLTVDAPDFGTIAREVEQLELRSNPDDYFEKREAMYFSLVRAQSELEQRGLEALQKDEPSERTVSMIESLGDKIHPDRLLLEAYLDAGAPPLDEHEALDAAAADCEMELEAYRKGLKQSLRRLGYELSFAKTG